MEELSCHIGDTCIQGCVIELHGIKSVRHGQKEEQASLRMRPGHPFRHMLFQQREQKVTLALV